MRGITPAYCLEKVSMPDRVPALRRQSWESSDPKEASVLRTEFWKKWAARRENCRGLWKFPFQNLVEYWLVSACEEKTQGWSFYNNKWMSWSREHNTPKTVLQNTWTPRTNTQIHSYSWRAQHFALNIC